MRNLKKILALALVFAMAFTFTAGAADFTDKAEIGASYVDDVNMLVELGVIAGYPDGSFGPQKNITRAEFAKMAYTLKYGSDTNGDLFAAQKSAFTDVEGNANVAWAKGYINYCANQKIVSGVGNNKFNPQGNITVAEATKMILVILGCDPAKEGFTGANWAANVTSKAIDLGVFDGWTGDPTALATRELVAKLMKNAIFAPVYTYSAITGTGSQMNALGNAYNDTLGQITMDLETVTGIVVANETYTITKNADLEDITVPACDEDETVIYYTVKGTNGEAQDRTIVIPVGVDDALLGNEVSVFFKADLTSDNWYTNVELIGDIMITNDTVVYEVPAIAVDMYPDGESESVTTVAPYISFVVDGVEKQVKASSDVARVAKNVDVQTEGDGAACAAFGELAWVSTVDVDGNSAALASDAVQADAFFADMGMPVLSNYRFVSVDGGKTYSYIFKMVNDNTYTSAVSNANYGNVTNYSEAKGAITISNIGRKDLEDVKIIGDVATDDTVVYFYENGLLNVAKVDTVTGSVEAINDDGSVVIDGEKYALWTGAAADLGVATLAQYYTENPSAMSDATTYYVYGNIVLDLEVAETVSVVEDYAVILRSTYDDDFDTAHVTLAFADNTQATYEVGKLHTENYAEVYASANDLAADFENNSYFGMIVKYKVMADGRVDLSGNYLKKIAGDANAADRDSYPGDTTTFHSSKHNIVASPVVNAFEGKFTADSKEYYALNDASILFVIYGNPQYVDGGAIDRQTGYAPLTAKAYKLVDKADQDLGLIDDMWINQYYADGAYAYSYAVNTNRSMTKGVIAAAMTIGGVGTDTGDAADGEALAYIAASARKYNVATREYYLEMTLIGDDGLFTAKTVDSCPNFSNVDRNLSGDLGKIPAGEAFAAKTFIEYAMNAEGVITNMDNTIFTTDIATSIAWDGDGAADEGLYVVNAVSERNDRLFFIEANVDITENADDVKAATQSSIMFAEDGYDVITIDGDDYVGENINKLAARADTLVSGTGNAVIQVNDEGEIIRVFSFVEGFVLA